MTKMGKSRSIFVAKWITLDTDMLEKLTLRDALSSRYSRLAYSIKRTARSWFPSSASKFSGASHAGRRGMSITTGRVTEPRGRLGVDAKAGAERDAPAYLNLACPAGETAAGRNIYLSIPFQYATKLGKVARN